MGPPPNPRLITVLRTPRFKLRFAFQLRGTFANAEVQGSSHKQLILLLIPNNCEQVRTGYWRRGVRQKAARYPNLPIAWKNAGCSVHKWRYRGTAKFFTDIPSRSRTTDGLSRCRSRRGVPKIGFAKTDCASGMWCRFATRGSQPLRGRSKMLGHPGHAEARASGVASAVELD